MTLGQPGRVLIWCTVFNYILLFFWFGMFVMARDRMYRLHTRWFRLTPEQFDMLHSVGMVTYKLLILVFNLIPLLAMLAA